MGAQLGAIIFTSVLAILKFVLTAACGTVLAKRRLLDSTGTRAISQCILNVFLPALIFSKVIQGIDQSEMKQVGVLVLTAILYTLLGLAAGFIVRFLTKIPRGWRYGVLATGAFSNWGDLPLVLITTIVASAPFNGTTDQAKGLAYVSVYIFVQNTLMFSVNGIWLVGKDLEEQDLERLSHGLVGNFKQLHTKVNSMRRRISSRLSKVSSSPTVESSASHDDLQYTPKDSSDDKDPQPVLRRTLSRTLSSRALKPGECLGAVSAAGRESSDSLRRVVSGQIHPGDIHSTIEMSEITRQPSSLPKSTPPVQVHPVRTVSILEVPVTENGTVHQSFISRLKRSQALSTTTRILLRFLSPPSVATISAFIIAAVPPLRALFVASSDSRYHWLAPDSQPPLDFFITLTEFIGDASVPCSLLILGYQLSKLEIGKMPVWRGAILMAILKLVVQPIIAVAWTQFLASTSLMSGATDNVLKLVMVLPSAVPSATSLLYITQIMAPEGREENVKYISVFLVVQYMILGVTLTITTVYTLNLIT